MLKLVELFKASMNDEGKLVLSNDTGATIQVVDDSATDGTYDGGSGFYGEDSFDPDPTNVGSDVLTTKFSFGGFLKLESTDGSVVRIEAGNAGLASPGTNMDLAALGFNTTIQQDGNDGYIYKRQCFECTSQTAIAKGDYLLTLMEISWCPDRLSMTTYPCSFNYRLMVISSLDGRP